MLRLYAKGRIQGHKRGKRNQKPNTSLLNVEGCANKEEAQFYLGKVRSSITLCIWHSQIVWYQRVAYVYKAQKEINGSKIRVIWGKVTRAHGQSVCIGECDISLLTWIWTGNSGNVRAQFRRNLPAKLFGASVRIVSAGVWLRTFGI